MDTFLRFCQECSKLNVSSFTSFKRRQLLRSILALLGAIETNLIAILNKPNKRMSLTSTTTSWLIETVQTTKSVIECLQIKPSRQSLMTRILLWCSSRESVEEIEAERQARADACFEKMVDEVLCRSFVVLDGLHGYRNGREFEIRKGMDLTNAKFDFLGCACELRRYITASSNDAKQVSELAQRIFENHANWFQREVQFQKQCTSVCYEWQLFSLKHQLGNVILVKEDIIDSQKVEIDELNLKLEQTMNNCIRHRIKERCATVH
eukprot:g2298.t1